jgi:hypothetical protein
MATRHDLVERNKGPPIHFPATTKEARKQEEETQKSVRQPNQLLLPLQDLREGRGRGDDSRLFSRGRAQSVRHLIRRFFSEI